MPDQQTIDITTTLTGPLAERLLARAARLNKTPVDYAADLVEHALTSELYEKLFQENLKLKEAVKLAARDRDDVIADKQRLLRQLPPPGSISFSLDPKILAKLSDAADLRKLSTSVLAQILVEHVARDDLFAAVLEQ